MKTTLLIFGITGDLSRRKLLPALSKIVGTGEFEDLSIIGVSRSEVKPSSLFDKTTKNLAARITFLSMDLAEAKEYIQLKKTLRLKESEQLLVYLAVPPSAATQIVDFLGEAGINTPNVKILFEKPFGFDYNSAREAIDRTGHYYTDSQLYRIDHYLAKEMAQNIVALRGGNALFSTIWNNSSIEKIEIVAYEKLGIEGRADFYEQTGALRDVVQGHLMQLLALVLMDIPHNFNWDYLPDLRLAALRQVMPADPDLAYRAQYDTYQKEVNNIDSQVETFVHLELASSALEWRDVPLILETGKALSRKATEIRIHLKRRHEAQNNEIIFRIQPNEGVSVRLFIKKPGYEQEFEHKTLSFSYPEDTDLPDAYEQVLVDAIRSRKSLFTAGDEVIRSWQILQPIQDTWNMTYQPLILYKKGTQPASVVKNA